MKEQPFTFHFETSLPVPLEEAFAWFEKPGAFDRLLPPFMPVRILSPLTRLKLGEKVHFKYCFLNDIGIESIHQITHLEKNDSFVDVQIKGPFSSWKHLRKFRKKDEHHTVIEEIVEYKIPVESILGHLLNGKIAKKLTQLFNYRQQVLKKDLMFLRNYPQKKLHVLMTGSNGLVGRALTSFLTTMGHHVTSMQRHLAVGKEGIFWDIENEKMDPEQIENFDAVIHLAGEKISQYWTEASKEKIYKSRIQSTRLLAQTLKKLKTPPKTFIGASAIHYYQMGKEVSEEGERGEGFLHHVVKDWEEEAQILNSMRVAHIRTGIVLTPQGGMLKNLLKAYKVGLGAKIGDGQMHMSWIAIDDLVYLYAHVLMTESLSGPINATSPLPTTQNTFSKTLARILKRPLFLKLSPTFLKLTAGQMGEEILLSDLNVLPQKLLDEGYVFQYPKLEGTLKHLLGIL